MESPHYKSNLHHLSFFQVSISLASCIINIYCKILILFNIAKNFHTNQYNYAALNLLYITTLSLTSTSTTLNRSIFYPYVVPSIDSSINSQHTFNKHSLIDSPIGVSSHINHNPIRSFVIMLLNFCFVCNGIPDIIVLSWIFLRYILHISYITFFVLY